MTKVEKGGRRARLRVSTEDVFPASLAPRTSSAHLFDVGLLEPVLADEALELFKGTSGGEVLGHLGAGTDVSAAERGVLALERQEGAALGVRLELRKRERLFAALVRAGHDGVAFVENGGVGMNVGFRSWRPAGWARRVRLEPFVEAFEAEGAFTSCTGRRLDVVKTNGAHEVLQRLGADAAAANGFLHGSWCWHQGRERYWGSGVQLRQVQGLSHAVLERCVLPRLGNSIFLQSLHCLSDMR